MLLSKKESSKRSERRTLHELRRRTASNPSMACARIDRIFASAARLTLRATPRNARNTGRRVSAPLEGEGQNFTVRTSPEGDWRDAFIAVVKHSMSSGSVSVVAWLSITTDFTDPSPFTVIVPWISPA